MLGVDIPEGPECVYEDISVSAYSRHTVRKEYNRLVGDIEHGKVDVVFVWDLDRLTRQPRQIDTWMDFAVKRKCVIIEANGGSRDLSQADALMQARIRADVAENESKHKGERQSYADRQRRLQGVFHGGRRPTGYTSTGEVIPEEAEVVRAVFDAFVHRGATVGAIRRALSGEHVATCPNVPSMTRPIYRITLEHNERSPKTAREVPAQPRLPHRKAPL